MRVRDWNKITLSIVMMFPCSKFSIIWFMLQELFQPVQLGNHHFNLPKVSVLREVLLKENAISTSRRAETFGRGYAVVIAQVELFCSSPLIPNSQLSTLNGRVNTNLLPFPNSLSTQIRPLCLSTISLAIDKPSPVPDIFASREAFVLKNLPNIFS